MLKILERLQRLFTKRQPVPVEVEQVTLEPSVNDKEAAYLQTTLQNVAQDFSAPLASIRGYAEMLRDISGDDPQKRAEHLQTIIQETDKMSSVARDLLDMFSLNEPNAVLHTKPLNLTALARQTVARLTSLSHEDGFTLQLDAETDLHVNADESRFCQVLDIMAKTAINRITPDHVVSLHVVDLVNKVRFEVTGFDTALDAQELWSTYQPAAALDTGIGLPLAKTLLSLHGAQYGMDHRQQCVLWFEMEKGNQ